MKSKIHEHQKNNKNLVSKKFVFSAVAMMAFSVSSMAETKKEILPVEKEIVTTKVVNQVSSDLVLSDNVPNCEAEQFVGYVAARVFGFSHQTATTMSYSLYFTCMQFRAEQLFGS